MYARYLKARDDRVSCIQGIKPILVINKKENADQFGIFIDNNLNK